MERYDGDLHEDSFRVDLSNFKSEELEDDVDEQLGDVISHTCLVGKVNSERFFNAGMLKSSLNQVWNLKGAFRVTNKKHNLFLVGFEYEEDSMAECDDRIENRIGSNRYVRVRIEFLPEKPLIPGIHVIDSMGIEHWVKVKYERLGEFCYRCGRVTHATRRCTKPKRAHEGQELESIYSFGPWLKAKETGHRSYLLRKPASKETKTDVNDQANAYQVPPDNGDQVPPANLAANSEADQIVVATQVQENASEVEDMPDGDRTPRMHQF
ncbi:hypothetical protein Tsubulata_041710 [Turnera subulata]|uniref:CCHC-type domain-containing protein n=1 Tax=Turnera subulata TaxID=218843 RepID=A0A9Q0GLY8_9ROSI|nr:hypothetical protein Tsubulata_041710 [Turnera subulata]